VTDTLTESPDEHRWELTGHRVTQLSVDASSVRLLSWSLHSSLDVRIAAPFVLLQADGERRGIDPVASEEVAPLLTLVGRGMRSLAVTRGGALTLHFGEGTTIECAPSRRRDAFQVQGGGALEGVVYAAASTGAAPWGG
jgi:hypothetical protein